MKWIKKEPRPDLILMDVQLPGVDGLELTRQIKAAEPSIPIIAYTSYAMPGDRERCLESGCDEYISKPVDLDGFLKKVSAFLFL
jgi:two-component system, cell cycle response regulator DivK